MSIVDFGPRTQDEQINSGLEYAQELQRKIEKETDPAERNRLLDQAVALENTLNPVEE